jgi:UDP-2,3-diacylglucosamine hydrolase
MSKKSRASTGTKDSTFNGAENEWLYVFCKEKLQKEQVDFFVFGHRHLPLNLKLSDTSTYINLGDWLHYNTYAVFDEDKLSLKEWTQETRM